MGAFGQELKLHETKRKKADTAKDYRSATKARAAVREQYFRESRAGHHKKAPWQMRLLHG